jgi:hypothetical protein
MVEPYPNTTPGIKSARIPDYQTFFQLSQEVVTHNMRGVQSAFETAEDPGIVLANSDMDRTYENKSPGMGISFHMSCV